MKLAQCSYQNNTPQISLKIPLRLRNSQYKIFQPTFLPFTDANNQICSITSSNSYLVDDYATSTRYVIPESNLYECERATHLCKLDLLRDTSLHSLCLQAAYLHTNISYLSTICSTNCINTDSNNPFINSVGPHQFVLTNVPSNLYIEYPNKSLTHIQRPSPPIGTHLLHLPCEARLLQIFNIDTLSSTGRTLIPNSPICHEFSTSFMSQDPQMPWTTQQIISSTSLQHLWTNFAFSSKTLSSEEFSRTLTKIDKIHSFQSPLLFSLTFSERVNLFFEFCTILSTLYIYYQFYAICRRFRRSTRRNNIPLTP